MPKTFSGARLERVTGSKQHRDGVFRNTHGVAPGLKGNPLPVLGEYFFGGQARSPKVKLPVVDPREGWARRVDSSFRLTWMGHSTVLLELDGLKILTDPVFGARASPLTFMGPKRFHDVPVRVDQLPELDLVLLSHDHYDHLCRETMQALARLQVPIVTSLGVGHHLEQLGMPASRITELDWFESTEVKGVRLTATPAQHFSGRGLSDRNHTLWSSWVIQTNNRKIFFSGDTGLTDEFSAIGKQFGPFDLVMLEVGAWNEAWGDIHLGPRNALQAFDMLGGGTLFPVHWGTFSLALHAWDEPAETLLANAQGRRIITPRLGLPVEPIQLEGATPWWREVGPAREREAAPALELEAPPTGDGR
jgi:L-ascorbate metabolism protein UlaG (beta-lactamase superfamily)